MRIMPVLLLAAAIQSIPALAGDTITQADHIRRLTALDLLFTLSATGERVGLFSSYDRRQSEIRNGRYVHWDANDDRGAFLGVTGDGWNVMAKIDAPGVITRFWCEQPDGMVRIMLDGRLVVEAPLKDIFNGVTAPFGTPLSYEIPSKHAGVSYFPVGFAESCRVLSRAFSGEYQIDYRTYPKHVKVQCFSPVLDHDAETALADVANTLRRGLSEKQLYEPYRASPHAIQKDLEPGEKLSWYLKGAGAIRGFHVSLTDERQPRDRHALHNMILRVYWDGREQPDIEAPLPAFFGAGFTRNLYKGLVMGTDLGTNMPGEFANEGWFMYCYYPMPFSDGARIEIENLNPKNVKKIGVMLYMRVSKGVVAPDALRFKARIRTEDPCKTFDYPILETAGAGRLVGCVLNIDCPREEWWGEGDHKIWLDDEPFPSILGTSTSGFLGAAEGLGAFRMPLQGVTLLNPVGKNSAYRWMIADNIPFHESIRFTLENWQYNQADDVYYNTVVYWYGSPGAADSFAKLSPEMLELAGLRLPGAVEIEGRIAGNDWGRTKAQKYSSGFEFSNQAAATITTRNPIKIDIPCQTAGKYLLSLRVQTGRSFGSVVVTDSDGKPVGVVKYDRNSDGVYPVGKITLRSGVTQVIVQCDKTTILDCWILEKTE